MPYQTELLWRRPDGFNRGLEEAQMGENEGRPCSWSYPFPHSCPCLHSYHVLEYPSCLVERLPDKAKGVDQEPIDRALSYKDRVQLQYPETVPYSPAAHLACSHYAWKVEAPRVERVP